MGLPGLSGFVADAQYFWVDLIASPWYSVGAARIMSTLATMSVVVTAVYVLRGLGKVFLGEVKNDEYLHLSDANFVEKLATGILIACLIFIGVFPKPLIVLIEGALNPIVMRFK